MPAESLIATRPGLWDEVRAWAAANLTWRGVWLAVLLTMVFGIPGPADRVFWAVKLGREADAPQGAVFSIVDLLLLATLTYAAWELIRSRSRINWSAAMPIVVLFAVAIVFSLVSLNRTLQEIPSDQVGAAFRGGVVFIRMAIVFACVAAVVRSPIDLRGLVVGLVLGAGALLANGAIYSYLHRDHLERLTAGTYGTDLYATLMAIVSLLLAGLTVMPWMTRRSRIVAGIAIMACYAGIAGTGTRTAAIALIVGMAVLSVLFRIVGFSNLRAIRRWLLVLAGAFVVSQILAVLFLRANALFGLILSLLWGIQSVPELDTRFTIWRGTLSMIQGHPLFGVGPGQWDFFRHGYGVTYNTFLDAHNAYLNFLADDGLIVFAAYVVIVAVTVWRGFSTLRMLLADQTGQSVAIADRALLGLIGMGAAVALVTDLDNSGSLNLRAQIFFWCLLAIVYMSPQIFHPSSRRQSPRET